MAFQSTVRIDQTTGIVGEIILDGPLRAQPGILRSTAQANNVIGRAFTLVAGTDDVFSADQGTGVGVFSGILVNPKVYATSGTTAGTLEPTLTLPNETQAEFLTMGIIIVSLAAAASIGDNVYYDPDNGALSAGLAPPGSFTDQVPNATVVRQSTTGAGLAIIQLTN
jgi:hypothetical protein